MHGTERSKAFVVCLYEQLKGVTMNKAQRRAARSVTSKDIAKRFPNGGNDPLGNTITLGNSFRAVNSLDFKMVKTGTMKGRK